MNKLSKKMKDIALELIEEADQYGFDVSFTFNKSHEVSGSYNIKDQKIEVVVGLNAPTKHILFILAHEVRHLIQHQSGLFKDYYREEHQEELCKFYLTDDLPNWYIPPNPAVGIRAEYDCHKWAINFLKERGIDYERPKYYIRNVMGYAAWIRYRTTRRERSKRASSGKGAA